MEINFAFAARIAIIGAYGNIGSQILIQISKSA